jgi:hypothetical protein
MAVGEDLDDGGGVDLDGGGDRCGASVEAVSAASMHTRRRSGR